MPRRKRIKDYGNIITADFEEKYINKWLNNQVTNDDVKSVSLLLKAEGGSLIQVLIAEDSIYNGIFHLETFTIDEVDGVTRLLIEDLEDLHEPKSKELSTFKSKLEVLAEKYEIEIPSDLHLPNNPLDEQESYPKLLTE